MCAGLLAGGGPDQLGLEAVNLRRSWRVVKEEPGYLSSKSRGAVALQGPHRKGICKCKWGLDGAGSLLRTPGGLGLGGLGAAAGVFPRGTPLC